MKLEDIYENLCVYDPRNSFYKDMIAVGELPEDIPEARRPTCFCDNCFRGNDKLALEILRLREALLTLGRTLEGSFEKARGLLEE